MVEDGRSVVHSILPKAITGDIRTANGLGITPKLISVGLDGWACDTWMILPYLQERGVTFTLTIRVGAKLYDGLSAKFFRHHNSF